MNSENLKYSVIIPTFNRSAILVKCLDYLANLIKPESEYEIIVIDNGSTDDTKDVVFSMLSCIPRLKYYYDARPGLHIGRNTGAENAKGDILCFLDDDSFVTPRWLQAIESVFLDDNIRIATGPIYTKFETEPPEWLNYFWIHKPNFNTLDHLSIIDFGDENKEINIEHVYGCNFIIRKSVFLKYGGSDPDCMPLCYEFYQGSGESGLSVRLKKAGIKAFFISEAGIYHFISKAKISPVYFIKHARYQAIVFSYTQLKDKYFYGMMRNKTRFGFTKYFISYVYIMKWKYGRYLKTVFSLQPFFVKKLRLQIFSSFNNTYNEHQKMFYENKSLREWILRTDYLSENGNLSEDALKNVIKTNLS